MSEAAPSPEQQAGRERPRNTAGRNLLKAHEEAVALVEGVPFTNNQAEPVKQKVSGCFRTNQGTVVYARLQAVISTCRKQTSAPRCATSSPASVLAGSYADVKITSSEHVHKK